MFNRLPNEVIQYLFNFIDLTQLEEVRLVCKHFNLQVCDMRKAKEKAEAKLFVEEFISSYKLQPANKKDAIYALKYINCFLMDPYFFNNMSEKKSDAFNALYALTIMLHEILRYLSESNIISYHIFKGMISEDSSGYLGPYGTKEAVELSGPIDESDIKKLKEKIKRDDIQELKNSISKLKGSKKFNEESFYFKVMYCFFSTPTHENSLHFKKLINACIDLLNQKIDGLEKYFAPAKIDMTL